MYIAYKIDIYIYIIFISKMSDLFNVLDKIIEEREKLEEVLEKIKEEREWLEETLEKIKEEKYENVELCNFDYNIGDKIYVRDKGEPWNKGIIISIHSGYPYVLVEGYKSPYLWEEHRPF